ncbi:hypothetical protein evm_011053 [Chilo suppressalis]|nr:hypothetical protein evm_011053 [Chilo suppressalis]
MATEIVKKRNDSQVQNIIHLQSVNKVMKRMFEELMVLLVLATLSYCQIVQCSSVVTSRSLIVCRVKLIVFVCKRWQLK